MSVMQIVQVNADNERVYLNLMQGYEAEFSAITKKQPDANGIFPLDTHLDENTFAFLAFEDDIPIGFITIFEDIGQRYEVCEFYIIPSFRKQHKGFELASTIWKKYPGTWVVKQIEGADSATAFWRKIIGQLTNNKFEEDKYIDPYWGLVTRQTFSISGSE